MDTPHRSQGIGLSAEKMCYRSCELSGSATPYKRKETEMNNQATTQSPQASETAGIKFIAVESFKEQINEFTQVIEARAYEIYERRGREDGHALKDWVSAEAELHCMVPVGILEDPERLEVNIRLLGCLSDEIEACLEPRRLLLRAQKEEEESQKPGGEGYAEQRLNGIFLALNLPDQVDPAKATAEFKDGNLCLTLPRAFA
jgi:HSP20 family molecular chaperone IbpA